jgi:hypothetical protein
VLLWLPTAALVAIWLLGLIALTAQLSHRHKRTWIIGFAVCGLAAALASGFEQAARLETATRLSRVWERVGKIKELPPLPPGTSPDQTVDAVATALGKLNDRVKELEHQLAALKVKSRTRTIPEENGGGLVEFLRKAGSHRVVVSCVPDDVEAFAYANEIANLLRQAGWDALGPETTKIFGEGTRMGVALYVRNGTAPPEAATLLVDGFTRFNIPYHSGVMPSEAIPDTATVELFVGHKP